MAETTRQCYDFLISPACQTTESKRARSITRLIHSATSGLQPYPAFRDITDTMRLHVLISRLHDGPLDAWTESDETLVEAMNEPFSNSPLRADLHSVLLSLKEEQWEATGANLRVRSIMCHKFCPLTMYQRLAISFIRHGLGSLDEDMLQDIKTFTENHPLRPTYADLATSVDHTLAAKHNMGTAQIETATANRRATIADLVTKIVSPDGLTWMDDGGTLSDGHFVLRAFADVEKRFDRYLF